MTKSISVPQFLEGKETILIVSPQPWDGFRVSKQHYATELALLGNRVFYVDPPCFDLKAGTVVVDEVYESNAKLFRVRYHPWFPYGLKFRFRWLFDRCMSVQALRIKRAIRHPITMVWDFDESYQFSYMKWFTSGYRIFHPVDQVYQGRKDTKNADVIISVAEIIADRFHESGLPTLIVDHGLGRPHELYARQLAERIESDCVTRSSQVRVGYVGNLLAHAVDRPMLYQIMNSNPAVQFDLFGPFQPPQTSRSELVQWVQSIQQLPNVRLHGLTSPNRILELAKEIDMWFVCYDQSIDIDAGTNSHKVLEYLSTGSCVVSNRLSAYEGLGLIEMPETASNETYPAVFSRTIENLDMFMKPSERHRRIQFALARGYRGHLKTIQDWIQSLHSHPSL